MMIGSSAAVSVSGHQLPSQLALKASNDTPAPGSNLASYLRTVLQAYVIARSRNPSAVTASSPVTPCLLGAAIGLSAAGPTKPLAKWNWQKSCRKAARLSNEPPSESSEPGTSALLLKCEHWLEATDPKHRYGSHLRPYYTHWLSEQPDDLDGPPSSEDFFRWLDSRPGRSVDLAAQGVSRSTLEASRVRYLSYEERGDYEVEVDEAGKLRYKTSGYLVHTQEDTTADDLDNPCPASSTLATTKRSVSFKHSTPTSTPTASTTAPAPTSDPHHPSLPALPLRLPHHRLCRRAVSAPGDDVLAADESSICDCSASFLLSQSYDASQAASPARSDDHATPFSQACTQGWQRPETSSLSPAKPAAAVTQRTGALRGPTAHIHGTPAAHTAGPTTTSSSQDGGAVAAVAPTRVGIGRSGSSSSRRASVRAAHDAPAERVDERGLAAMLFARQQALEAKPQPGAAGKKEKCGWIYVMDITHRIYIHRKERGMFHHSSFVCGAAVLAAGGLEVREGRIDKLSAHSGHYRPDEGTFLAFVEYLKEQGADLQFTRILGVSGDKGGVVKTDSRKPGGQRGALLMRRNSF